MNFPHSCVLYLRHNSKTKHKAYVRIRFQDDTSHVYSIPIVKVQEYTKDELFEKNLLALLPYYFMRYEKTLPDICRDEKKVRLLMQEFSDICQRLENSLAEEKGLVYVELIYHIKKISSYLFRKQPETRKRMEAITMGGQVYETLSVQFLNKGQKMEKISMIDKFVASGICSFEKGMRNSGNYTDRIRKTQETVLIVARSK